MKLFFKPDWPEGSEQLYEKAISMSGQTAIARNKPSAPMRRIMAVEGVLREDGTTKADYCLDFGSGKGADALWYGMEQYDPNFHPERPNKQFEIVTMIYVLNTLPEPMREEVIRDALEYVMPFGMLYIAVRDDIPWERSGKLTSRGTVQYKLPHLSKYVPEAVLFDHLSKRSSYLIYAIAKLPEEGVHE